MKCAIYFYLSIACVWYSLVPQHAHADEAPAVAVAVPVGKEAPVYKLHDDRGWKNNDGQPFNKRHSVILLLGPGSAQNGQPNPLGLPPGLTDIDITYVHPTGIEGSVWCNPRYYSGDEIPQWLLFVRFRRRRIDTFGSRPWPRCLHCCWCNHYANEPSNIRYRSEAGTCLRCRSG